MKIACIGWGSLVWRPENLKIQNKWFEDGPLLPIEFTRISDNDRVTLIIDRESSPIRTLWALMSVGELSEAIESLRIRENIQRESLIHHVLASENNSDDIKSIIIEWLRYKQLDAAIWTGLSYSKKTNQERPSIEEILHHLTTIDHNSRKNAEEYIRKTPRQVDTAYRRIIELHYGWTPFY